MDQMLRYQNVKNLENLARLWNYGRSLRGDLILLNKKTRIEIEILRERERVMEYNLIIISSTSTAYPTLYNPYQYN